MDVRRDRGWRRQCTQETAKGQVVDGGIGWTSWKKRWFILTRTSLVFYRVDPGTLPPKGNETNSTLGGIDLNNSGSVVVKADKKLLTVLFPDGRTFTLKAETSEDLYEWKAALESALAQAPSAALAMGQNGIFQNDTTESVEATDEPCTEKEPEQSTVVGTDMELAKNTVLGRPILLALEEIDGSPSFLEKALQFIEDHGTKVEGILRQSADVEEVKHRVREYEQGKVEFSSDEDAHVIGDCIKYVLREMPSSPVPASCCTALVDAYRTERGRRVDAIRSAIYETFPEPNRVLMQRILKMMQTVAAHKLQNRMSLSAIAACMAPLLLRPLLAGDCEFEDDFSMGGDGSIQLLKAAAAANHAQLIVIILLEEFDKIFDEDLLESGSMSSELYSDSEDDYVEDDDLTDNEVPEDDGDHDEYNSNDASTDNDISEDEGSHNAHNSNDDSSEIDIPEDDKYHDQHNHLKAHIGDSEHSCSELISESHSNTGSGPHDNKLKDNQKIESAPVQEGDVLDATKSHANTSVHKLHKSSTTSGISSRDSSAHKYEVLHNGNNNATASHGGVSHESTDDSPKYSRMQSVSLPLETGKVAEKSNETATSAKRPTVWGRAPARKNLSMESIDLPNEDEIALQKLENTVNDLKNKIDKEAKENVVLQESLERRKEALYERRLALEQEVERLQEQLQNERDFRASLESGLMNKRAGDVTFPSIDNKKVADLHGHLNNQPNQSYASLCESCGKHLYSRDHSAEKNQGEDIRSTSLVDQREKFLKQADASSGAAYLTQNGTGSPVSSTTSYSDQSTITISESLSKNSTCMAENIKVNCENVETQCRDSVSPSDGQSSQEQRTNIPKGSVEVGDNKTSKEFSSSLPNKQSPVMQWPSSTALNILKSQSHDGVSSSEELAAEERLSPTTEEPFASSSALAKLTNRLNFLKERRAQLAIGLQTAQNIRASSPDGPPPTSNPPTSDSR
ncbi:rho GTPase-activating protein 6-like isoform X1 [Canna indica]|uniref:Rho GTPase-activating protein 6-like isoform X1 n=1 Tax=Canna indica TaxID=4628 RepID=A0AAQ3K9T4_9LILI|nr:rho GTPase-activating protein 6-like isoform X1 [Canna indica]